MSDLTSAADGGDGGQAAGSVAVTHRVHLDPSRSMKAITGEVELLLDDLEEAPRRSGALLASELIAQVVAPVPDWNSQPVALTIQLREDAVRIEAAGPVAPAVETSAGRDAVPDDPLADWGPFVIDRLANRWGLGGGSRRTIWAEIETLM